jgi:hypothetical protein
MYVAFEINIRAAMTEQLVGSALRRQPTALVWVVNTAKMQPGSGDGKSFDINAIALCAMNTPAERSNRVEMMGKTHAINANDDYYEFNIGLRRLYAGKVAKTLMKQPANDQDWSVAA